MNEHEETNSAGMPLCSIAISQSNGKYAGVGVTLRIPQPDYGPHGTYLTPAEARMLAAALMTAADEYERMLATPPALSRSSERGCVRTTDVGSPNGGVTNSVAASGVPARGGPERAPREEWPKCLCADIQRSDASRHFRECPLRAVYPEASAPNPQSVALAECESPGCSNAAPDHAAGRHYCSEHLQQILQGQRLQPTAVLATDFDRAVTLLRELRCAVWEKHNQYRIDEATRGADAFIAEQLFARKAGGQ